MNHKVKVTVTEPNGTQHTANLDVIAADADMALARVLSWYDRTDWSLREVGSNAPKICSLCVGSGLYGDLNEYETCPACKGTGSRQ